MTLKSVVIPMLIGIFVVITTACTTPPPLRQLPERPTGSQTELGVTWVPRLGIPKYGHCVRVLSIDGGGIRGIIPAMILAEIESRTGRPIAELFDLVVGTSTGSILVLGLTKPDPKRPNISHYTAQQLVGLYRQEGQKIFPPGFNAFKNVQRIFSPKYSQRGLEEVLTKYFGDFRLGEALTNVGIPAYEIEDHKHFFFESFSRRTGHLFMYEVAMAATAAPSYFPPVRLPMYPEDSAKGYVALIDGGVFANNPAIYALSKAPIVRSNSKDILLVSLGTGTVPESIKFEETWGWGLWSWMEPLLNIVFSDPGVEDELRDILYPNSYYRFQPKLTSQHAGLDDASPENIQALEKIADQYIKDHLASVIFWLNLKRPPDCPPQIGGNYESRRPTN